MFSGNYIITYCLAMFLCVHCWYISLLIALRHGHCTKILYAFLILFQLCHFIVPFTLEAKTLKEAIFLILSYVFYYLAYSRIFINPLFFSFSSLLLIHTLSVVDCGRLRQSKACNFLIVSARDRF